MRARPAQFATYSGSTGVKFATGGGGMSSALVNGLALSSTDGANVLAYLRGDRSLEGTTYRTRIAGLGDITTAEPVLDNGVVASTEAVRGTSHRMAISPTMSLRPTLATFIGP